MRVWAAVLVSACRLAVPPYCRTAAMGLLLGTSPALVNPPLLLTSCCACSMAHTAGSTAHTHNITTRSAGKEGRQ